MVNVSLNEEIMPGVWCCLAGLKKLLDSIGELKHCVKGLENAEFRVGWTIIMAAQ